MPRTARVCEMFAWGVVAAVAWWWLERDQRRAEDEAARDDGWTEVKVWREHPSNRAWQPRSLN